MNKVWILLSNVSVSSTETIIKDYETKKVYRYWLAEADNRLLTAYLF